MLQNARGLIVSVLPDRTIEIAPVLNKACGIIPSVLQYHPGITLAKLQDTCRVTASRLLDSGAVRAALLNDPRCVLGLKCSAGRVCRSREGARGGKKGKARKDVLQWVTHGDLLGQTFGGAQLALGVCEGQKGAVTPTRKLGGAHGRVLPGGKANRPGLG